MPFMIAFSFDDPCPTMHTPRTPSSGAPLLGVRGVCIVGHGSSNDRAIMNGIRVAAEFAQAEVNSGIEAALRAQ